MAKRRQKILCGCYIRVSTDEQAQVVEGSLKNQEQRLHNFVKHKNQLDNETWAIAKEYIEKGRSGKDTNRPKFQEMRQDIENGEINTVIFTEISRLSRSTKDFLEFAEFLNEHDANFVCLANPDLDTSSLYGKIIFTLLTVLMEFEREINSVRSKNAYNDRAGRGLKNGGHVFGYDLYEEDSKHGHLKVNKEETKIVQWLFRSYLKEKSVHKLVRLCNERGYRTKTYTSRRDKVREGKEFTYSTVKQILKNHVYIARNEIHKKNKGKPDVDEGQEYRIVKTDKWKPIIDEDVFNQVQVLLGQNRDAKGKAGKNSHSFLLSDLIICQHCNNGSIDGEATPLTHGGTKKDGNTIPYYIHRSRHRKQDCPLPKNLSARKLDEAIWKRLMQEDKAQIDEAVLKHAVAQYENSDVPKQIAVLEEDIAETSRAIQERQGEHDNILKSLGQTGTRAGKMTVEFLGKLSTDIESLGQQLKSMESELAGLATRQSVENQVKKITRNRKRSIAKLPADERLKLVKNLLKRVVLRDDNIILDRHFGSPIVGVLKEHEGKNGGKVASGKWRFVEVGWVG